MGALASHLFVVQQGFTSAVRNPMFIMKKNSNAEG